MRTYIKIIVIAFLCLLTSSCEDGKIKYLKQQIELLNTQLPMNCGIGGDWISVKYNEESKTVQMYYVVSNEWIEASLFQKSNQNKIREQFRLSLSSSKDNEFIRDIDKAGVGLLVSYKSSTSGKSTSYKMTNQELREILANPMSADEVNKIMLNNMIELQNSMCPKEDENGTLAKVELVNGNIVYYYQLDEDFVSIPLLKRSKSEIHKNIEDAFKQSINDYTTQRELNVLIKTNTGYQFRYFGNKTKDYVDIIFTPQELSKYTK